MRYFHRLIMLMAALLLASALLSSCSAKFDGVYYADGDSAAGNMLIFGGGKENPLAEQLAGKNSNAVVSVSMGITEEGTYTISGDTLTFTFGEVTSKAEYDKANDAITWYGVKYIKPVVETTAQGY